jgi:3-oxoadipate CoA-transferase alpha subunit
LIYNKAARNFGPIMCMAATTAVVQVGAVLEPGELDPEGIVTPGIFVQRVVAVADPALESVLIAQGARYPLEASA